jgi:hypothetical protein
LFNQARCFAASAAGAAVGEAAGAADCARARDADGAGAPLPACATIAAVPAKTSAALVNSPFIASPACSHQPPSHRWIS